MLKNELGSLVATLGLSLIALLLLFPVEAIMSGSYVVGEPTRDLFDHLFLIDHWGTQALGWNYPSGGSLMPPDISGMVFAYPWLWLGRVTAYNLALLTQFLLCVCTGWLLGRKYGSGVLGGLAMSLSPIVLSQFCSGEAETVSAWTIPLFLYFLLTPRDRQDWFVGGTVALSGLCSWYYGTYLGLILLAVCIWRSKLWTANRNWLVFRPVVISLVCIAPFAIWYGSILGSDSELFRGLTMSEYMTTHPRALASFSTDPAAWIFNSHFSASHSDYLGWLPLILFIWGIPSLLKKNRTQAIMLLIIVFVAAVLSMGPVLHIRGNPIFNWMPYRGLVYLPGVDLMRLPHRWMMVVVAGCIPFIAMATRSLSPVFVLLLIGEVVMFSSPTRTVTKIDIPDVVERYSGPVLELPARTMGADARGQYLVWQRIHKQPIPYSLLMTGWSEIVSQEPLVQWVASQDSQDPIAERIVEAEQFRQDDFANAVSSVKENQVTGGKARLKSKKFWGVVLHLHLLLPEDGLRIQRRLEVELGAPSFESEEAVLWEL